MNDTPLKDLLDRLVPDAWRAASPFDTTFGAVNDQLCAATDDTARSTLLGDWLSRNQPCLFGRAAARSGRIEYCFLTETDLYGGDDHVTGLIAARRFRWRRRALKGESSAFVILAVSPLLAVAEPNDDLFAVAQKLAELYLMKDVPADVIRHDDIVLRTSIGNRGWKVGVNFFGAQGDGRWWKDHRIPGGVGLSMNSVGHLAYVQRSAREGAADSQRYGLDAALLVAMQLLNGTTDGPDGRNTWLHPVAERPEPGEVQCQVRLPNTLAPFNRCQYAGLYHTDQTLPSSYFTPAHRSSGSPINDLDLTYLHHDAPDNPDYRAMGLGAQE